MRLVYLLLSITWLACASKGKTPHLDKAIDSISFLKSDQVKLSAPILSVDSIIFNQSAKLVFDLGLDNAEIMFSINYGPWQRYGHPLTINENAVVNYKAQKSGFKESTAAQIQLVKGNNYLYSIPIDLLPEPNKKYPGRGSASLNDLIKGTLNFKLNDVWCGFQNEKVEIGFNLKKEREIENVIVSILEDHGSWIFAPRQIQVYADDKIVGEKTYETPTSIAKANMAFLSVPINRNKIQNMKLVINSIGEIPDWHPGSGNQPWLFIDEIIVQ